jgi:hypothetical protein
MDPYLLAAGDAIEAATSELTVAQVERLVPDRWSVAQILEHLTMTFRINVAGLDKALAAGETKAAHPSLVQWLSRLLVVDIGYFPRAQAPAAVQPTGAIPAAESRQAIGTALAALDEALDRAAARFGERTPLLRHAFFAGLTVRQWRKFHWRHTLHHMRQVRQRAGGGGRT